MMSKSKKFKIAFVTIGGKGSEGCLIYIAMSKHRNETISHLRKQIKMLHTMMVAAGTKNLIENLKTNPNYDILNDDIVRD